MHTLTAGVLGATGSTGAEVCRLLRRHPDIKQVIPFARSRGRLGDYHPRFVPTDLELEPSITFVEREDLDVAFLCTPTGEAMRIASTLLSRGIRVIDLSADHRFPTTAELSRWHGIDHPNPSTLGEARYGLTEFSRDELHGARLIANPGCFAITAELALMPLALNGLLGSGSRATLFAVNGMTGAGSNPRRETSAAHSVGTLLAYGLDGHRHAPEIEYALARWGGAETIVDMSTAHADFARGIHLTASVQVSDSPLPTRDDLIGMYQSAYGVGGHGEQFVHVIDRPRDGGLNHKDYSLYPLVSSVTRTNDCHIGLDVDERTSSVKIVATTDNLVKGAAGSAVQNMNVALGLRESSGLDWMQ